MMKRAVRSLAVLVVAVMTAAVAAQAEGEKQAGAQTAKPIEIKKQTLCPVMTGNPINKNLFVEHQGKRVYVCCQGCLKTVKADPEKYIKQMEAEGITLDTTPAVTATNAPAVTPPQKQ